jgi:hypothetical protein
MSELPPKLVELPQKLAAIFAGVAFFVVVIPGLFSTTDLQSVLYRSFIAFLIFFVVGWAVGTVFFYLAYLFHQKEVQEKEDASFPEPTIQIDIGDEGITKQVKKIE